MASPAPGEDEVALASLRRGSEDSLVRLLADGSDRLLPRCAHSTRLQTLLGSEVVHPLHLQHELDCGGEALPCATQKVGSGSEGVYSEDEHLGNS